MGFRYLFGPVPSRRLGLSLGVDLVPPKVCNLNCVYCESGQTNHLTTKRNEYIPVQELKKELSEFLNTNPTLDFITFSGAGEPLLNSKIGEIISYIRKNFPQYKLALITNSVLLTDINVIDEILGIDVVLPSLDAISSEVFKNINRPFTGLKIEKIIEGLVFFRKKFKGQIWLEVFVIPGINDFEQEIAGIKKAILQIKPDEIHLNTLDRPGTENWIQPASAQQLNQIKEILSPLKVKIVSRVALENNIRPSERNLQETILELITRRPSTIDDFVRSSGYLKEEINTILDDLIKTKRIKAETINGLVFYKLT